MSALTAEARERMVAWIHKWRALHDGAFVDEDRDEGPTFGDLRALLADSEALERAERERDEAQLGSRVAHAAQEAMRDELAAALARVGSQSAQVATLREFVADVVAAHADYCDGREFGCNEKCWGQRGDNLLRSTAPEGEKGGAS